MAADPSSAIPKNTLGPWRSLIAHTTPNATKRLHKKNMALVNVSGTYLLHLLNTGPFLRIASEYPGTTHPIHRRVIEHKDKLHDYLAELLKPYPVDRNAAAAGILCVIDGALSTRMVYGTSREIPLLSAAEAVLNRFQSA
jgi:hypothetical protein